MDDLTSYLQGFLAILLLTSFVKIFTVFSIMRYGIGLEGNGLGLVFFAVSLALALAVVGNQSAPIAGSASFLSFGKSINQQNVESNFRPFLERNVDKAIHERVLASLRKNKSATAQPDQPAEFNLLVASFILSELKRAFQLGFLILIPFLVVDLVVTNILAALGVTQLSQAVVSLPIKIVLFFAIDGWTMLTEKLIGTYS